MSNAKILYFGKVYSPLKIAGFTLPELLITLFILILLLMMAIPSSWEFLAKNRAMAGVNRIARALYYARSEAILRGEKIIFCKSTDGISCHGQWRDGQMVIDALGNNLRLFPALPKTDQLIWNSSAGKDDRVEWLPTGYTNGQRGTFYYCTPSFTSSRRIVLLDTGRWYIAPVDAVDFSKICQNRLLILALKSVLPATLFRRPAGNNATGTEVLQF